VEGTSPALNTSIQLYSTSVIEGFSCALKMDNTVECWGDNNSEKTTVPNGLVAKQIALGYDYACAIKLDGSVQCRGRSGRVEPSVTDVPNSLIAKKISLGKYHACAIRLNNTVVCWGDNSDAQATPPEGLMAKEMCNRNVSFLCFKIKQYC
jgi:alpha-tubulin suppressor-like RCC1 family protein